MSRSSADCIEEAANQLRRAKEAYNRPPGGYWEEFNRLHDARILIDEAIDRVQDDDGSKIQNTSARRYSVLGSNGKKKSCFGSIQLGILHCMWSKNIWSSSLLH